MGVAVSEAGKKTFMYFSSDVGKGFIISDDEEVTGVISVVNMSRKKSKNIRWVKMVEAGWICRG